jgi:predicted histidine transporter YuiF (NhaC family)
MFVLTYLKLTYQKKKNTKTKTNNNKQKTKTNNNKKQTNKQTNKQTKHAKICLIVSS